MQRHNHNRRECCDVMRVLIVEVQVSLPVEQIGKALVVIYIDEPPQQEAKLQHL